MSTIIGAIIAGAGCMLVGVLFGAAIIVGSRRESESDFDTDI